jgi:hypothetical protein
MIGFLDRIPGLCLAIADTLGTTIDCLRDEKHGLFHEIFCLVPVADFYFDVNCRV